MDHLLSTFRLGFLFSFLGTLQSCLKKIGLNGNSTQVESIQIEPFQYRHEISSSLIILTLFFASRAFMYVVLGTAAGDFSGSTVTRSLCQWDCGWYMGLIDGGYHLLPPSTSGEANWAFFPLYPLLAASLKKLLALSSLMAGQLVSNAAALAAGFVASRILCNTRALIAFCTLLYFGPFSFYFATVYTEALFVFLSLSCFYFLSKRQYLAAGAMAALLSATRSVGVMMTLAIAVTALQDHLASGRSIRSFPFAVLQNPPLVLAVLLAPLGLFLYMGYLHIHVGDALAFSHVQRAWDRQIGNPFTVLISALKTKDLGGFIRTGDVSVRWMGLWSVLGLVLTVYLAWLRRFSEAIFTLLCILIPLSTHIASMPRYVIGLAPLLIISSQLLASNRILMMIALPMLALSNVFLLVLWQAQKAVFA
jgi:hypothetical protein